MKWLISICAVMGILFVSHNALAGTCTKGTDCYCDCAGDATLGAASPCTTKFGGNIYDSSKVFCADFEDLNFYEYGAKSFDKGSGSPYNRGGSSQWEDLYAFSGGLFVYADGVPRIGTRCGFGPGAPAPGDQYQGCTGTKEYCSTAQGNLVDSQAGTSGGADCWGPGANTASRLDIQRTLDFKDEVTSLTLTGGSGTTADVGAGKAHMAGRVPQGQTGGIFSEISISTLGTSFGMTSLIAFASNAITSKVFDGPWKTVEFSHSTAGGASIFTGHNTAGVKTYSPFSYQFFQRSTDSDATCTTAMNAATKTLGQFDCDNVGNFYFAADTDVYLQSRDWPMGTWGCLRAYYQNMNTATARIEQWFTPSDGPSAGVELKILDISNMDLRGQITNFNLMHFDQYANVNAAPPIGSGAYTLATTYGYMDNFHIRNGSPVSCAQVEFLGAAADTPTVDCTSNSPVAEGGTVTVTATRSFFTGTTSNSFLFNMDDDADVGTCTSANGAGDSQDDGGDDDCADAADTYCACTKTISPLSVATHSLECESHAATPTEDATGTTDVVITAIPGPSASTNHGVVLGGGASIR